MTHRYLARIVFQAETPLLVASGDNSFTSDALVMRDWNNMPFILGTSLTGVLRHALQDGLQVDEEAYEEWERIFGYEKEDSNEGVGARLKISNAHFMVSESKVSEAYDMKIDEMVRQKYEILPIRNHVKINDKGNKVDNGLFTNEVVYKGSRFIFELELKGDEKDINAWTDILHTIASPTFRIGQGTRNGYGSLKVHQLQNRVFNLKIASDFSAYINHDPSFNACLLDWELLNLDNENKLNCYRLELKPDSMFFHFGAGIGDNDIDNLPNIEEVVRYQYNKSSNCSLTFEKQTLIPASSIKGAIAHRTCFHYNRLIEKWADLLNLEDKNARDIQIKLLTSTFNEAVYELFGAESGTEARAFAQRGYVVIDDLYLSKEDCIGDDKTFNHVAIDRFTGGALDSALFSERVSTLSEGKIINIDIYLTKKFDGQIVEAFEEALKDICKGLLPLGGMTTKGHGIFVGSIKRNKVELFNYK